MNENQAGFTLAEVLLVLVLAGAVILLAFPNFKGTAEYVRQEAVQADILMLESAARLYYLNMGQFPEEVDDLFFQEENNTGWRGPYLEERPVCPLGFGQFYVFDQRGRVIIRK